MISFTRVYFKFMRPWHNVKIIGSMLGRNRVIPKDVKVVPTAAMLDA